MYNGLHIDLPQRTFVKSVKEIVACKAVSKESHDDSLLGHEKKITIDFFETGENVNSTFYCQFLRQYFNIFIGWPLHEIIFQDSFLV